MTWLKLSDDFADDCARAGLSDAAVRTHVEGLLWTMRRETGGYLDDIDVRKAIETENAAAAIAELLAVGYWVREAHGCRIVHHMEHQPEPDVLAARRDKTAERVRRHRRKRLGLDPADADVTPLRNALPGSGRDGSGRVTATEPHLREGDSS